MTDEKNEQKGFKRVLIAMTTIMALTTLGLGIALATRKPVENKKPDVKILKADIKGAALASDYDFLLMIDAGDAFDRIHISRDGKLEYVKRRNGVWEKVRFDLTDDDIQEFKTQISKSRFMSLEKAYKEHKSKQALWYFRIQSASWEKEVFCQSYYPNEAVHINRYVQRFIIRKYEEKIELAKRYSPDQDELVKYQLQFPEY